jgi:diaminopimelate epimerase
VIKGVLIYPSGNSTAIVTSFVPREKQKEVSLKILDKYKEVEQVGFCEEDGNYLQMVGGEFCCNAARSFGFLKLKGKDGEATFNMSGTSERVLVSVKNSRSKIEIPININFDKAVTKISEGSFKVNMSGITHLIITEKSKIFKENAGKKYADDILEEFNLKKEIASSVSFLNNDNKFEPYVFVRDINTLYAETACGSGSLACAIMYSWLNNTSTRDLMILQPSGSNLIVSAFLQNNHFVNGSVDGDIKILDNNLYI